MKEAEELLTALLAVAQASLPTLQALALTGTATLAVALLSSQNPAHGAVVLGMIHTLRLVLLVGGVGVRIAIRLL